MRRHLSGDQGSLLQVRGRGPCNRGARATFLLPHEPIERLPSSAAPRRVGVRTWRRIARAALARATPSYTSLRSPVHASLALLPFQLEPALAIVSGLAARVLIADDVGLGKTIQAGLVISEVVARRPEARALVVAPAGLREQWQAELGERLSLDSTVLDSAAIAWQAAGAADNPWSIHGIVVTSLDYVKRPEVVRALEPLIWDVVVFDEAHALAGRSDRAKVASLLARRARTLVLLTATPHTGDDDAFVRLTSIGDFANRFPLLVFRRTRIDAGLATTRRTLSVRVRPTGHELEMHAALMDYARLVWRQAPAARLAMSVLTRRACSSAWSLARSVETRLRLLGTTGEPDLLQMTLDFGDGDDGEPGGELGAPGLADHGEERRWLEHLLRLARLAEADESKFRALTRFLRRAGEPAIVFTEYRDTLHRLGNHVRDLHPALLHGGMTSSERRDVLRRFVTGEIRLLLATDAASEGLNLHQRCRLVVNLELPWTPIRLEQRIGRVERLGQSRRVHAVHLLAAGTCEEASVAVLLRRMGRVASVLRGLRPAAIDTQIAAAALGEGVPPQPDADGPVSWPGVVFADLGAAAQDEARRLDRARALFATAPAAIDSRPSVTRLRRRRAASGSHWVYRVVVEDGESQPIWDTVVGIGSDSAAIPCRMQDFRVWLEAFSEHVAPFLTLASQALLSSLRSDLHASMTLAVRRERAIAEHLEQRRARLATALLQPGLFDRRNERAAAAQQATIDVALGRCRRRFGELDRLAQLSVDPPRLVAGAIRR